MDIQCPHCGSDNTRPSRVRSRDPTQSTFFRTPVRCRQCKERFWILNRATVAGVAIMAGVIAMIGASIAVIHSAWEPVAADRAMPLAHPLVAEPPSRPPAGTLHETARAGDAHAQYRLALAYLTGQSELQDFAEAIKWLGQAADQGHAQAQYTLGMVYRTGQGVDVDAEKSYMWLNLAVAGGVQEALPIRDAAMRSLTAPQLARAQKAAREFLESRPKIVKQAAGEDLNKAVVAPVRN